MELGGNFSPQSNPSLGSTFSLAGLVGGMDFFSNGGDAGGGGGGGGGAVGDGRIGGREHTLIEPRRCEVRRREKWSGLREGAPQQQHSEQQPFSELRTALTVHYSSLQSIPIADPYYQNGSPIARMDTTQ